MDTFLDIYTPPGYDATYANLLRAVYAMNGKINKAGISAPSKDSLCTTMQLYELVGKPLDKPKEKAVETARMGSSSATQIATGTVGSGGIYSVHVGGTNGKGTTSFKLSEVCRRSGLCTGLFVSPHISCFRERIQVGGELISETDMLRLLPPLLQLCVQHQICATQFELTFILAAVYFQERACEVVILEVGLGGESDATNVVDTCLAILTSVALDHTRVLGSTVEEIASKKAGIFKNGVQALVGPCCPMEVITQVATKNGVKGGAVLTVEETLQRFGAGIEGNGLGESLTREIDGIDSGEGEGNATGYRGGERDGEGLVYTDRLNARICLAALHLLREQGGPFSRSGADLLGHASLEGIHINPPCRWQRLLYHPTTPQAEEEVDEKKDTGTGTGVEVYLDVGHNPAAMAALMRRVRVDLVQRNRPVRILYAMSRDKDVRACVSMLLTAVSADRIHFAQSANWRAVPAAELAAMFEEVAGQAMTPAPPCTSPSSPSSSAAATGSTDSGRQNATRESIRQVLQLAASEPGCAVLCCGTGYLMPEVLLELGVNMPSDSDTLRE